MRRVPPSTPFAPAAGGPLGSPRSVLRSTSGLLAEIAAGTVSDAEGFQAADEFLMLRDLIADDDFEQLCETLYHFLWREAQQRLTLEGVQRGADRKIWIDPDRRLVRVWFATDRKLIHGFNVSFEEAAIRAAQIGYDLKVPGEMAFYSWPSHGSMAAYSADEATITASVPHIAQFLPELSERSKAERIHLFVHSMGNRGFLRSLERLVADRRPTLRLGQVFFCAPDEDVRTFKDTVNRYPHRFERRTLLVSPDDQAVCLSQWKHGHDRVGSVPPVTVVDGIETIEVGGFGLLALGHGYFASAGPVIENGGRRHPHSDLVRIGRSGSILIDFSPSLVFQRRSSAEVVRGPPWQEPTTRFG